MFDVIITFFKNTVIEQLLKDPYWSTLAFAGQLIFGGRFIYQWIVSEYKRMSYIPRSFWFMSLVGSLILLVYSVHIKNPVFMAGFSVNTLIYIRNLHLIYRKPQKQLEKEIRLK